MPTVHEQAKQTLRDISTAQIETAESLTRLARKYVRIQERWCSEEMSERTSKALEQSESRLEERIRVLGRKLGAQRVEFGGDPRGFTVKLDFGHHGGNTFGGDGLVGVHGS